jgi:hypothetical protein
VSNISTSKKSENLVWEVINKFGKSPEKWEYIEIMDESGNTKPQAVNFSGAWYSYPDFRKNGNREKPVLLIEVKGYDGFFSELDHALGIKERQFKSYSKIQFEEQTQVRICFVIWKKEAHIIFWETLNNIKKMEKQVLNNYQFTTKSKPETYYVFDCREFRQDYQNLPKCSWDE